MLRPYWGTVAKRALKETREILRVESRARLMISIAITALIVAALLFFGSDGAATDEIITRSVLAGVVLVAFPFVFLWRFISVPANLDSEKELKNSNLLRITTQLTADAAKKVVDRDHVLTLSLLREQSGDLVFQAITQDEYNTWSKELTEVELLTLKYIASYFSHQEAVSYKTVKFPTENFIFKISDEHNKRLQEAAARFEKLESIIQKHSQDWSPITQNDRERLTTQLKNFQAKVLASNSN